MTEQKQNPFYSWVYSLSVDVLTPGVVFAECKNHAEVSVAKAVTPITIFHL